MSANSIEDKSQEVTEWISHHVSDGGIWSLGTLHLDFANANLPADFRLSGLMSLIGAVILCWLYCRV